MKIVTFHNKNKFYFFVYFTIYLIFSSLPLQLPLLDSESRGVPRGCTPAPRAQEHGRQPHSKVLATSSTTEVPSVHWKTYFRRLLRVGWQHWGPQPPRHSSVGTLEAVAHDTRPFWRWITSRTTSPRHGLSAAGRRGRSGRVPGREPRRVLTG